MSAARTEARLPRAEVLAMAEHTLERIEVLKCLCVHRIAEAERLSTERYGAARWALLHGGDVSEDALRQLDAARIASDFYRRVRLQLDVDQLEARITLELAHEAVAAEFAALAASELDRHQQLTAAVLQQVAEMEGGAVEATIAGPVSDALKQKITDCNNAAESARVQAHRYRQELEILKEQRRAKK